MIFSTGIFGLFLALTLALYWLTPVRMRRYTMIGAGLVFYGYYFPRYLLLIGGMTAVTYLVAWAIIRFRGRERLWLAAGIILCLLVLGFFKYWKMAVTTVNALLAWTDWGISIPLPHILVPLGISFFTFEFIHFLCDVYDKKIEPAKINAADFTLFAFFYPTLVCGPIKRYQSFQEQAAALLPFNREAFSYGAYRVVLGLGKKFIIADTVGRLTFCLATPETTAPGMLVLGVYAYAIKIYFDFAGYSDIAIGISRMFGYQVPENFDRPYLQPNIAAFWRHWHMSLSSWIRDYIYIPLGGSRLGLPRTLVNLLIAFSLCGLWHGAAWNFVAWGAWHGLGMAAHRLWRHLAVSFSSAASVSTNTNVNQVLTSGWGTNENGGSTGYAGLGGRKVLDNNGHSSGMKHFLARAAGIFFTFHFVTAGWVLFAAPNLATAVDIFKRCLGLV